MFWLRFIFSNCVLFHEKRLKEICTVFIFANTTHIIWNILTWHVRKKRSCKHYNDLIWFTCWLICNERYTYHGVMCIIICFLSAHYFQYKEILWHSHRYLTTGDLYTLSLHCLIYCSQQDRHLGITLSCLLPNVPSNKCGFLSKSFDETCLTIIRPFFCMIKDSISLKWST